jgi:hypothetical protein
LQVEEVIAMQRRAFLTGTCAFGGVYFWIPRITVLRAADSPRDAVNKSMAVIAKCFGAVDVGKTDEVVAASKAVNPDALKRSLDTMKRRGYLAFGDYYEIQSRQQSMFGGFAGPESGKRYCHAYTHPNKSDQAIAYIASPVVFICQSYLLEACARASWSKDKMNDYCYPSEAIEVWEQNWHDDIGENEVGKSIHVHCARGTWSVTYSSKTRAGQFTLYERSSTTTLYQQNFEIT